MHRASRISRTSKKTTFRSAAAGAPSDWETAGFGWIPLEGQNAGDDPKRVRVNALLGFEPRCWALLPDEGVVLFWDPDARPAPSHDLTPNADAIRGEVPPTSISQKPHEWLSALLMDASHRDRPRIDRFLSEVMIASAAHPHPKAIRSLLAGFALKADELLLGPPGLYFTIAGLPPQKNGKVESFLWVEALPLGTPSSLPVPLIMFWTQGRLHGILPLRPEAQNTLLRLSLPDGSHPLLTIPQADAIPRAPDLEDWIQGLENHGAFEDPGFVREFMARWEARPNVTLTGLSNGFLTGSLLYPEGVDPPDAPGLRIEHPMGVETVPADLPGGGSEASNTHGFAFKLPKALLEGEDHPLHFQDARFGFELPGSPYRIGPGQIDSALSLTQDGTLRARLAPRGILNPSGRLEVEITLDGRVMARLIPQPETQQRTDRPEATPAYTLAHRLPDWVFDGRKHVVGLMVIQTNGRRIRLTATLAIEASFKSQLLLEDPKVLRGWIVNEAAPLRPVRLSLWIGDQEIAQTVANRPHDGAWAPLAAGFEFRLDEQVNPGTETGRLILKVTGTDIQPFKTDCWAPGFQETVEVLQKVAALLRSGQAHVDPKGGASKAMSGAESWVLQNLIAPSISSLREAQTLQSSLNLQTQALLSAPKTQIISEVVSVLIPVFEGLQETVTAIERVIDGKGDIPFSLTVINDGSPNPVLTETLLSLQALHGFQLIEQPRNLGFVETVNRHLMATPDQDVVILNADTEVPPGWLDRLKAAADSAPEIGTVTPLSNHATLLSYPAPFAENPMPEPSEQVELDALMAEENAGVRIDLPTGVGFCLYLKRAMIRDVGFLDAKSFGRGYGEENDYCLRARALGWRHVGALDLFVAHQGSRSFGEEKSRLLEDNLKTLAARYPDYPDAIESFRQRDPIAPYRNRVALAVFRRALHKPFLFVTHGLGGGTERSVLDLAQRLEQEGQSVLILRCDDEGRMTLRSRVLKDFGVYAGDTALGTLTRDLQTLGIAHVHLHHTIGFDPAIWQLPQVLGVSFDFTVHDYLSVCPRITFLDLHHRYCGERQWQAAHCDCCIAKGPLENGVEPAFRAFGGSIEAWREAHASQLARARRVFAPSHAAADSIKAHLRLQNLVVLPHPTLSAPKTLREIDAPKALDPDVLRVAVLGAIGPAKGYEVLLEVVADADRRELPLEFTLIGTTADNARLEAFSNVRITGRYPPEMARRLIRESGATVALFLSPWPETWSYTLSEALAEGLVPVSFNLGAIAERMMDLGVGRLIPPEAEAPEINAVLVDLLDPGAEIGTHCPIEGMPYASVLEGYYGLDIQAGAKTTEKPIKRKRSAQRQTPAKASGVSA